jgi:hypothetical protein
LIFHVVKTTFNKLPMTGNGHHQPKIADAWGMVQMALSDNSLDQEDALSAVNLILREGNQGQFPKGAAETGCGDRRW